MELREGVKYKKEEKTIILQQNACMLPRKRFALQLRRLNV